MERVKLLLAFVMSALVLSSPCYALEWATTFGGISYEGAHSIQQTADGGYVVAGWTDSFGQLLDSDAWILRLDSDGKVIWEKTYGGSENESAWSVRETSDGGFIVGGQTMYYGIGIADLPVDIWVLKLDSYGTVEWQKVYGGTYDERVSSVQQTFNQQGDPDGYIVTGVTESFGEGGYNMWILKLDADGNVAWQKTYAGGLEQSDSCIEQTFNQQGAPDGYIVAGGHGYPMGPCGYQSDFWVVKLNLDGTIAWQKAYGYAASETDDEFAYCIQQTSDGGYIVAGQTQSVGAGSGDLWILKLNSVGDVIWQKAYGGSTWDEGYSIQQTTDGAGYIVAGYTRSFGAGLEDVWILKLDLSGNLIWQKTYGISTHDRAFSIQQIAAGGYILAGDSYTWPNRWDLLVLKVNANGEIPGCSYMGTSDAIVTDTLVVGQNTTVTPQDTSVTPPETSVSPQDTFAETSTICSVFIIDKLKPRPREPGHVVRIIGSGFGDTQGDSVVHIGPREFDLTSPRIKLWSETKIKVRIPKYKCEWFKGQDYRTRKVWVTVGGVDSNVKRIRVLKPDTCP